MNDTENDTAENVERELALSLGSVAPEAVAEHPLIAALAIDAPSSARLVSTYYDTADRALIGNDIVLRVREKGGKYEQTVKGGGPKGAGIAARDEWESALTNAEPQWPAPVPGPTGDLLREIAGQHGLSPCFVTDFTRNKRRLSTPGGDVVELAIDTGEIRADGRTTPLAEVELELKSGSAIGLFDLALGLIEDLPLTLQTVSKGERGYQLAAGSRPVPILADKTPLDPAMTVAEAFDIVLPSAAGHAVNNTPAITDGSDPVEGVHQMRVGLRRLRAALGIFKPYIDKDERKQIRETLRPCMALLGPARDIDVFLTETLPPSLKAFDNHPSLSALNQQAVAVRDHSRSALCDLLTSPEYTRIWLTVGRWLTQRPVRSSDSINKLAKRVLTERAKQVKHAGAQIEGGTEDALHELRIDIKNLRYAAEFFAALYDEDRVKPVLKALKKAQDVLGHLNDAAVCEAVLDRIEAKTPSGKAHTVMRGAGMVSGWIRAKHGDLRAECEKAYANYAALEPFWK